MIKIPYYRQIIAVPLPPPPLLWLNIDQCIIYIYLASESKNSNQVESSDFYLSFGSVHPYEDKTLYLSVGCIYSTLLC